ncbi:septal ring lytic transglycosylase RlpA family protein [Sulfuricystis multivorans]|uniref:septal ring lytic transglycosylase RlpA family protein n=1 Tax=Sulfuricystis multivorans TaxID=2211108 RepID=UPI000F849E1E|nr:SPOR domain-containing protein [Sulfuricystis multivorans]
MNRIILLSLSLLLAACGGQPPKPAVQTTAAGAAPPAPTFRSESAPGGTTSFPPAPSSGERKPAATPQGGGYYLDDGPLDHSIDLAAIPDAVPKPEPLNRFANRPYSVFGRDYVPLADATGYRQQGVASWYGRRYHGQKTSSGEPYDMFAMTAAHPTLPIPSYARVTRIDAGPDFGKSVVVRIIDRGPFLHDRLIDLSYVAAWKLGLVDDGSGRVLVESVLPESTGAPFARAETAPAAEPIALGAASASPPQQSQAELRDVVEKGGHYLQLGAFASRDNAEALKAKLYRDLGELGDKLVIRSAGNLHRLQLGPWLDEAAARRIAERLKLAFDLPSMLVK